MWRSAQAKKINSFTAEYVVDAVGEQIDCYIACRGFDYRTEKYLYVSLLRANLPTIQEQILEARFLPKKIDILNYYILYLFFNRSLYRKHLALFAT